MEEMKRSQKPSPTTLQTKNETVQMTSGQIRLIGLWRQAKRQFGEDLRIISFSKSSPFFEKVRRAAKKERLLTDKWGFIRL